MIVAIDILYLDGVIMDNLTVDENKLRESAKERTVKTQSFEYDLETTVNKIFNNIIKLNPEYQRRHRWPNATSTRLIESLILNIPIPEIYLSTDVDVDTETENARYSVIDGQQRLHAIYDFFKNKYELEGLELLPLLNGYNYNNLPSFLIRRLEERTVKFLRIDSTLDSKVKIDVFERLNSASVTLNRQELRNAVFGGKLNIKCKELANNNNFRKLLQIKDYKIEEQPKVKKMEDVEYVLRFFGIKR